VVAEAERRQTGCPTREAFAGWPRYEVFLNENCWQRIGATSCPTLTSDAVWIWCGCFSTVTPTASAVMSECGGDRDSQARYRFITSKRLSGADGCTIQIQPKHLLSVKKIPHATAKPVEFFRDRSTCDTFLPRAFTPQGTQMPRIIATVYVLLSLSCLTGVASADTLRLAVASTANEQGLATALAERFEKRFPGHHVEITAVGAISALDRARKGYADAVLTHHPASENLFMDDGLGLSRTLIMYNHFAILGPNDDPLRIAGENQLAKVLQKLADNSVDFFVQGKESGTYQRLAELLKVAKVEPGWPGYQSMQSSSRTTVLAAAQFKAYAFADLGTYLSLRSQISGSISPLYRDHKALQNYYHYIVVNPNRFQKVNSTLAQRFLDYLISTDTQNFIDKFGQDEFQTQIFTAAAHLDSGLQVQQAHKAIDRQQQTLLYLMLFLGVVLVLFVWLGVLHIRARKLENERRVQQARFALAVSGTNDGIWDWDHINRELFLAPRTRHLLGTNVQFTDLSELLESVIVPSDYPIFGNAFAAFCDATSEHYLDTEFRIRVPGGERWIRLRGKALRRPDGGILRMAGSITDSTAIHEQQEEMRHQALHDPLTDLPNRTLLFDRLQQTIVYSQRHKAKFALLMIDLDRFKQINDTLGHSTGDKLIQLVAERLVAVLRDSDTVCRLGGDEFAMLLPSTDATQAVHVAKKISIAVKRYYKINENHLIINGSIGITLFPQHGNNAEELLQHADVAMYQAKKESTGIAVYSAEQDANSMRSLELESSLREAIDHDGLELHFQPKLDLRSECIVGAEALLRWTDPAFGNIHVEELITLAEKTGLIRPLTRWVVRKAMQTSRHWSTRLNVELPISVNLSLWDLQDPNFAAYIHKEVERWYRKPGHIEFEITESSMMSDPDRTIDTLRQLATSGHQMSVDDFGTGFSSLAYLKKFPVRSLKIDKSFVLDMENDCNDRVIVKSTIDLAHGIGMVAIAEGVENEASLQELMRMGCDIAQGYYISRPLPPDKFIAWIHEARWKLASLTSLSDQQRANGGTIH
jgi:diguanylate cyclase (GGDEF)-like protein